MTNPDPPVALSPALFVVLRRTGLVVLAGDDPAPVELDAPGLRLLQVLVAGSPSLDEALRTVAAETGADVEVLALFAKHLMAQRLILETTPGAHRSATTEPTGPPRAPVAVDTAVDPEVPVVAVMPQVFRVVPEGFEHLDHTGRLVVRVDARELAALTAFRSGVTPAAGYGTLEGSPGLIDRRDFDDLVRRAVATRLLVPAADVDQAGRESRDARMIYRSFLRLSRASDEAVAAHKASEAVREQQTGVERTRVVPVDHRGTPTPLSLGMVVAQARSHKDGVLDQHYQFVPSWLTRTDRPVEAEERPGIYLFSNYIWSHGQNLAIAAQIKQADPFNLTIHGGPDTPKYEGDVEEYFRVNPQVDVAVHGEGEATFAELLEALVGSVGSGEPDLTPLRDVPGLSFRLGDEIVRTEKRDRITDLDSIPSPFLTGVFDVHAAAGMTMGIIETNRGCPYGCTFCDWGSATTARVRKFDIDRVFAELEWCARHEVSRIFVADANFGIFDRDVEIAERVAALKAEHGFPKLFSTNYAKNTTKHLRHIVRTFAEAGILTQGLLSLQTMDAATLKTVRRSNIKVEKYEDLAREFRKAELPLFVDLMLGLPGATTESFRSDLQQCVNREITAKVYPTELLVNSPMNDPAYRQANRIETSAPLGSLVSTSRLPDGSTKRALVVSSASFDRADYDDMLRLRRAFLVAENFGVLRQISRFVRQEAGVPELDLYDDMRRTARAEPHLWPALAFAFQIVPLIGTSPVSWALVMEEARRFVTERCGVVEGSDLDTVFTVQHALLPTRAREFPIVLDLPHDYAAWHRAIIDAKDSGNFDWEAEVPRLRDHPPGRFEIDDPFDVCGRGIGFEIDEALHASWELASPVARAVSHEHDWDS